MSMCAAINRTLEQGIPLTDPKHYGKINETDLDRYFMGDDNVSCPMIKQRVDCLHEISKVRHVIEIVTKGVYQVVFCFQASLQKLQ